jgi:hypothetical protein
MSNFKAASVTKNTYEKFIVITMINKIQGKMKSYHSDINIFHGFFVITAAIKLIIGTIINFYECNKAY